MAEKSVLVKLAEKANGHFTVPRTKHRIILGDSRQMPQVESGSVHLVVTSPPYWTLKKYEDNEAQLGAIDDYTHFLDELDKVWAECFRVLAPGGRMCVVVGDVCLSRRKHGKHQVIPLHADIQVRCRKIGLDNLAPIFWYKIANMVTEMGGNSYFLGKPYEPNAVIKNDVEYILLFRKGGDYRHPTEAQRTASLIEKEVYHKWFQQVWTDVAGASLKHHPAPYPKEVAYRLIRMFSFVGDTVLDPFLGTGTTTLAAIETGRSSIGIDVEPKYVDLVTRNLRQAHLLVEYEVEYEGLPYSPIPQS